MNTIYRVTHAVLALLLLSALLTACQKPEGPAERAGKDIDHATQQLGQEMQEAGRKLQDAAQGAKK